ncbi:MAG TPA: phage tail protein [Burkholderiaceae bacterium]|nr:phage tail protein [Burkholderiaceae bacterium]
MKASSASSKRARRAAAEPVGRAAEQPFTNLRFLVAIEGMQRTGAVEVVFPTARIVAGPRKRREVQFDSLVIRRGLTSSTEWFDWWDKARRTTRLQRRDVQVILLDSNGAPARRWIFAASVPLSYSLSPLNALAGAAVIESLELRVGDFDLYQPQ